jgi:hypothetical protein
VVVKDPPAFAAADFLVRLLPFDTVALAGVKHHLRELAVGDVPRMEVCRPFGDAVAGAEAIGR